MLQKEWTVQEVEDAFEGRGLREGIDGVSLMHLQGVAKMLRLPGDEEEDVPPLPAGRGKAMVEARERSEMLLCGLIMRRLGARFNEKAVRKIWGASFAEAQRAFSPLLKAGCCRLLTRFKHRLLSLFLYSSLLSTLPLAQRPSHPIF